MNNAKISLERHIDLSCLGIGGGKQGNRCDVEVFDEEELLIADFKFGHGYVDPPQYNFQGKAYCLGALFAHPMPRVTFVVVQPENDAEPLAEYSYTKAELDEALTQIIDTVEATKKEDAPLNRGWHCDICHCRQTCPEWRKLVLGVPRFMDVGTHLDKISPAERGILYANILDARKWFEDARKAVEGYIHEGHSVEGYEIGPGRISRVWKDPASALLNLFVIAENLGVVNPQLSEVVSPAQAEKILGKDAKEAIATLVEEQEGNPSIKRAKKKDSA
jgi:hypothetical protein